MYDNGAMFFHILPYVVVLLLLLIVIAVNSYGKKHRWTALAVICCLVCIGIVGLMTSMLLDIRSRNSSYYDNYDYEYDDSHEDDAAYYMKTDAEGHWNGKKETSFKYDGDKWVTFGYQMKIGEWTELDAGHIFDESTVEWRRNHAVVNVLAKQSLADKIAGYQSKDTFYSVDSDSGKELMVGARRAFFKKQDRKEIKKYYSDMNHYSIIMVDSEGERQKMPSEIANWLNDAMSQEGELADWQTDEYDDLKNVHWALLNIISNDGLFEGWLEIVEHDGRHYLHESKYVKTDGAITASDEEREKELHCVIELPDYVFTAMQPYLDYSEE